MLLQTTVFINRSDEETEPGAGERGGGERGERNTHTKDDRVYLYRCLQYWSREGDTPRRDREASIPGLRALQVLTGLGLTLISPQPE